jgi:MoxR-like ATPase
LEATGVPEGSAPRPLPELAARLLENIEQVVEGKREVLEIAVAAFLARAHVLIEDVPGVGKTTIAKAIASSLRCRFGRVQATSDLLPSDIVGITVLDPQTQEFRFHRGPLFTNILLVDEINRATPRTQSALLEAMSEGQVTVDRDTHPLEAPFFVIATQNPAEQVGTYFLPESQLDRFAVRIQVGYPSRESERQVLRRRDSGSDPLEQLQAVCTREEVLAMQEATSRVRVAEPVADYLLGVVAATRERRDVLTGVSTRGALTFQRMTQARAFLMARDFVTPDDVKAMAVPVLAHRILLASRLRSLRDDQVGVVTEILAEVPCP